jgi:hypothetical protein
MAQVHVIVKSPVVIHSQRSSKSYIHIRATYAFLDGGESAKVIVP